MSSRTAIACLLGLAGAAALSACDRQSAADGQANAAAVSPDEATATAAPAAGTIDRSHKGEAAPATPIAAPGGGTVTLAAFRGKPLLVNLWATWCAPCVAEMPTLDRAATALAGKVTVLAVAQDDAKKVAPFFAARRFVALKPYVDASMGLSIGYGANLPTTILYDARGREVWRRAGGADWTGDESRALIAEAG